MSKETEKYSSKLTELLSRMTYDQIRFVAIRSEFSTKKEAAEALGLSPVTVYHWPEEIDEVLKLIALETESAAREVLKRNALKAAMVKISGLDSGDERVSQGAATEILDRQLGRATQRSEVILEDVTTTDEERANRILAILDAARARRDGQTVDG